MAPSLNLNSPVDGRPRALPPYTVMLAVDIKDFGGRRGADHESLTAAIPAILDDAFLRGGLGHLIESDRFDQASGDGWLRGYDPSVAPFLLNPFLFSLEEELTDRNHGGAHGLARGGPLRMRVSINLGPVENKGRIRASDGSGDARVATHRLLDSKPVREMLEHSDPSATHVAAIISARFHDDVIKTGYAAMHESLFYRVPVRVKTYEDIAYLHVPRASGRLLAEGLGGAGAGRDKLAATTVPSRKRGRGGPKAGGDAGGGTLAPSTVRVGGVGDVGSASTVVGGDHNGSITSGTHLAGSVGAYYAGATVGDSATVESHPGDGQAAHGTAPADGENVAGGADRRQDGSR